jgi:pantoate--beta-alanine ligase
VVPGGGAARWEGQQRPGHFTGVLTVVAKLFQLVQPEVAVFGQKDIQQAVLIQAMVRDLDWPLELVIAPTVREADGLALSSRNAYLTPDQRREAVVLSVALRAAERAWEAGEQSPARLEAVMRAELSMHPLASVDYIAIVDGVRLASVERVTEGTIVAIAARFGGTRLLDNIILGTRSS